MQKFTEISHFNRCLLTSKFYYFNYKSWWNWYFLYLVQFNRKYMLFYWGWYEGVLYGIHSIFFIHNTKLSSQNSSVLSVTMILGTPFLANIENNICLTVVAFLLLTFITFSKPKKEFTKIKNKPMSQICAWSIWTLVHGTPSLGHLCIFACLDVLILQCSSHQVCHLNLLCVAETLPWISLCTLNYVLP